MVKQIVLCFVVAIAMTLAGFIFCQNEGFKLHYCALLFVCTFGASVVSCCIWSDLKESLNGLSKDSKKEMIGDSISFTVLAWVLPLSLLAIELIK